MTKEDAIAIIRKEYLCVDRDCDIERSCGKCDLVMPDKEPIIEAYKMAIKALQQEPFINKPCVSSGVCEHDKNNVLEEIREEIKELRNFYFVNFQGYSMSVAQQCLDIIDKHIGKESEWIQEQK